MPGVEVKEMWGPAALPPVLQGRPSRPQVKIRLCFVGLRVFRAAMRRRSDKRQSRGGLFVRASMYCVSAVYLHAIDATTLQFIVMPEHETYKRLDSKLYSHGNLYLNTQWIKTIPARKPLQSQ